MLGPIARSGMLLMLPSLAAASLESEWKDETLDPNWDGSNTESFMRTLWVTMILITALATLFLIERCLDMKFAQKGNDASKLFYISVGLAIATAVGLAVSLRWLMHYWMPWAVEWQAFLLLTLFMFCWSMARKNNATREFGNAAVCITCVLILMSPLRDFCDGAILAGVGLSILIKVFRIMYPWLFGGWVAEVQYFEASFMTGDVWLVTGTSVNSTIIKYFTNSNFSHTGLIVVDPPQEVLDAYHITECARDPRGVYLIESIGGMEPITDCEVKAWSSAGDMRTNGIQMSSLMKSMLSFKTFVYNRPHFFARNCGCCKWKTKSGAAGHEKYINVWRRLTHAGDAALAGTDREINAKRWTPAFTDFILSAAHKKYEGDFKYLALGSFGANEGTDSDKEYFCSEFVAAALQHLTSGHGDDQHAMCNDCSSDNYVPEEFEGRSALSRFVDCGCECYDRHMQPRGLTYPTWRLEPQVRMKYNPLKPGDRREDLLQKHGSANCSMCGREPFDFADPENQFFLREETLKLVPGEVPELHAAHCEGVHAIVE